MPRSGRGSPAGAADLDLHAFYGAAAIDDGAVAARAVLAAGSAAGQLVLLDQLETDAFARRHQRDRQSRFGEAVTGAEGGGLEPGLGEAVDERLHDVGADHVGAIAGDAPARQVEALLGLGLRAHPARANVVAEGRGVADRGARVTGDHVEPGERPPGEILGLQIIDRHLQRHRRQEAADQPHVVVPGQPRDAAVGVLDLEPDAVGVEIVEQGMVSDRDAVRKAGRTARILQIGDIVGFGRRKGPGCRGYIRQRIPIARGNSGNLGGRAAEVGELGRIEQKRRIAAIELYGELLDIGFAPAEAGRQRQRHRPGAGIDRAEKAGGEFRAGFRDQGNPIARFQAEGNEAIGVRKRVLAQLGIGVGPGQRAAGIMEIEPARAGRRIIQRLPERFEIGGATGQGVERGRCARGREGRCYWGVAFGHAVPFLDHESPVAKACGRFVMVGDCGKKGA